MVVDYFADDPRTLHCSISIGLLLIRVRHRFVNTFVGCQKALTVMSPVIRTQAARMAIWRARNGKELATIFEELSALYPANVIKAFCLGWPICAGVRQQVNNASRQKYPKNKSTKTTDANST